jgi:hypothetical protein
MNGKSLKRIFVLLLAISIAIALVVLAIPISTTTADDSYLTYDQLKAYEEKRQDDEWSRQLVAHAQTLVGKRTGQCVVAIRQYFGVPKSEVQGMAKSTKPNTQTPRVGSIIILKMSKVGHVGIVIKVDGDLITYFDSNGQWTQRGAIRTIIKNDRRISGYRITK